MDMFRVTANWTGFIGAPGYSNFFFATGGGVVSDAQQVADRVGNAFSELVTLLPSVVTIRVESEVAVVNSDTGEVTDFQSITPPATITGSADGDYAAPVGAVVNWRTSDVRFGRRIRGRTFLVPLASFVFDSDGTISDGQFEFLNAFASTMTGGDLDSELGVWSRPRNGSGGVFATVNGHNIPDLAAVLRSRRD